MKNLARFDLWGIVLLFLLAIPAERHEWFSFIEEQTLALRQSLRITYADPQQTAFIDAVVLVNTDEAFFDNYQGFPLKRTDIGRIVANLHALGAKVIGIDLLMDFPSAYGEDPGLAEVLSEAGNTVIASRANFKGDTYVGLSYPTTTLNAASATGYVNIISPSAIVTSLSRLRIYPEITQEPFGWPIAVQILADYLDAEPTLEPGMLHIGDELAVPLDRFNDLYIDYAALPYGVRFLSDVQGLSAWNFLDIERLDEDEREELAYWVQDRIVLVGDTSEVSHDRFQTPVGVVHGVEVIANTLNTLFKGGPLQPASERVEIAISLALLALIFGLALIQRPHLRLFLFSLVILGYLGVVSWLYVFHGQVYSITYNLAAIIGGVTLVNLRFYLAERTQRAFITNVFGHYLSPTVVSALVKDPSKMALGGELREMTAFFSDIAGSSSIAEKLSPEAIVHLLNEFLTEMCNIIIAHGGTIDKFEGDAIIAFWGAPLVQEDHATRGVLAAVEMQARMKVLRQKWIDEGLPAIHVRMGINSGPMVVGNMGSQQRMDYTIMGDAVNLTARLEGANKFYGTHTMISGMTRAQIGDVAELRKLDVIRVVGKEEAVEVYEVLAKRGELDAGQQALLTGYNAALAHYQARDFARAETEFAALLERFPDDGPCRTYLERCAQYRSDPPGAGWDGVYTLTGKG